MTAKPSELVNFFWYCRMAAMLIDDLPERTATQAMSLRAVRMATLCVAGRDGVRYTSALALEKKNASESAPGGAGNLVKEHVIPVSVIHTLVRNQLRSSRDQEENAIRFAPSARDEVWLTPVTRVLFQDHLRAWLVAKIIEEWTLLAWITREEHEKLKEKGLAKMMPLGWTSSMDRFDRYVKCGIEVAPAF